MRAIYEEFAYDSKATEADTPPIDAFRRHGVVVDEDAGGFGAVGDAVHHGDGFAWFILDVTLPMMERLANLTDTEIAQLAAYVASLGPGPGIPTAGRRSGRWRI